MSRHPEGEKTVSSNRRAPHLYAILERFEAGIVLTGSEVKSLRQGRASIAEAYGRITGGELWLENMHIPPYEQGERRGYDPLRPRKLLLHRRELERLTGKQKEQRLTLVPIRVYFSHGLAKVEIGLGRGKAEYEKREATLKRQHDREMERALGRRR
ncbi:MAG: SsrA-binding protein SmpB [Actinomycetota bacterium]